MTAFQTQRRYLQATTNESIRGLGTVTFLPSNQMKQEGMIESFPIIRDESIARQSAAEQEPWKLRRETLEQLREISSHPAETLPLEQAAPTDAAIASWFNGPGGLIELGGINHVETRHAPLLMGDALPDHVRIAQDAMFGLHRTLDLVASTASGSNNETIRDAILAAVAGEQDPTASPIHDPAANGMSALAYPGAALIASTLAVAGRHRHANAMIATQKQPAK